MLRQDRLPLRFAIGRSKSEEIKVSISTIGSGGLVGREVKWGGSGSAGREVETERLVYTCNILSTISFSKSPELGIGWGIWEAGEKYGSDSKKVILVEV